MALIAPSQLHSFLYGNIQGSIGGSASPLVASAYDRLAFVARVSEQVCEKFGTNGYAG